MSERDFFSRIEVLAAPVPTVDWYSLNTAEKRSLCNDRQPGLTSIVSGYLRRVKPWYDDKLEQQFDDSFRGFVVKEARAQEDPSFKGGYARWSAATVSDIVFENTGYNVPEWQFQAGVLAARRTLLFARKMMRVYEERILDPEMIGRIFYLMSDRDQPYEEVHKSLEEFVNYPQYLEL